MIDAWTRAPSSSQPTALRAAVVFSSASAAHAHDLLGLVLLFVFVEIVGRGRGRGCEDDWLGHCAFVLVIGACDWLDLQRKARRGNASIGYAAKRTSSEHDVERMRIYTHV